MLKRDKTIIDIFYHFNVFANEIMTMLRRQWDNVLSAEIAKRGLFYRKISS